MNKNTNSTRYYSDKQEKAVCTIVNGHQTSNSGAAKFAAGDVINQDASLLVECKTMMTNKDSMSIKKEWLDKNKLESRTLRLTNNCLAFNFGPDSENYFVINARLMQFLVENLEKEEKE